MTRRHDRVADLVLVVAIVGGLLSFQAVRLDLWQGTSQLFVAAQDHNIDSISVIAIILTPFLPGIFLILRRRDSLAAAVPAWPVVVLLGWGALVSIVVLNPITLLFLAFLSVVIFVTWYVNRLGFLRFIDLIQILFFVLIALSMVIQVSGFDPRPDSTAWYAKLDGLFGNATFAGATAGMLAVVSLSNFAHPSPIRRVKHTALRLQVRHFDLVAVLVGVVGVVWTQQRTSIIAVLIASPVVWLRNRYFAAVVLTSMILAPAFLLGIISENDLSPLSDGNGPTLSGRAEIWSAGVDSVAERPVFGFGPAVYALEVSEVADIYKPDGRNACPCLPENGPLQSGLAFGIPGAALAALIFLLAADGTFGSRGVEAPLIAFFVVGSIAEGHAWSAGAVHSYVFFGVLASVLPATFSGAHRTRHVRIETTEVSHAPG